MIDRRKLMTFLACAFSACGIPMAMAAPRHQYLEDARDILMPGMYLFSERGVDAKIEVHHDTEYLLVIAWRPGVEPLGFAITRESIKSGYYKAAFAPSCTSLRNLIIAGGM